ncbi:MAG: sigma-70 family RNA polymerase sigma factor [Polyangiaceae bacterium]
MALVSGLRRRDPHAATVFFQEFEPLVERTIGRIIGFSDELPDATQEAFLRAMRSLDKLRDPQALVEWLLRISVFTASDFLRHRKRRRRLFFFEVENVEEPPAPVADESGREALRATYRVLDRMSPEERTLFALRFLDGMDLDALASAHDCSRSTVKRRLARATARFLTLARREHALSAWVAGAEVEEEVP